MAQITNVTSEALQAQIRSLLPSQQGFGEDLQASNVIVPVIDLTTTAEGSSLGTNLQTALAFGSQTNFSASNGTSTIVSTPGFYRVIGTATLIRTASDESAFFTINDGSSGQNINAIKLDGGSDTGAVMVYPFDFVIFLRAGDSFRIFSSSVQVNVFGSVRQIADVNGNLVNPSGFSSE